MKILHVLPDVDSSAGGIPVAATHLAAAQAMLDHQVTIATYRKVSDEKRIAEELSQIPGFGRVRLEYLADLTRGECLLGRQTRHKLDPLVGQFDIVHIHGVWDLLERLAGRSAKRLGVPYVIAPHGMLDPWSLARKKWKKKLALAMGYRRMLDECAFVHALNEEEKRLLEPLRLRCPVRVIPNGIFLEEITEVRTSPAQPPYILFLGRLHSKKGLDYLADAFALLAKQHPMVQLLVVGPDSGAREPFLRKIANYSLNDRVKVLPPQFGKEKWKILAGATAFCLPSRQEGFSMAILEALACGVPVVISKDCHFPEVAQANAGFVLPLNAGEFAEAFEKILNDAHLAQRLGQSGKNLISSQYTWPIIAARSIDAYRAGV